MSEEKHYHTGHRQRLKTEFLARRVEGWPDHKVLELILCYAIPRGDVNPIAHDLIDRFGSLAGVLDASMDELQKVPGVGEHTAILLRLFPAVGQRYQMTRSEVGQIINNVQQARELLGPYFFGARNEKVYGLFLDNKRKALGVRLVAEGSIAACDINIRRVLEEAIGLRASKVYLAHNHISNLALPSDADWLATDAISRALAPAGITLEDHLIFVDDDAVSLMETEGRQGRPMYQLL